MDKRELASRLQEKCPEFDQRQIQRVLIALFDPESGVVVGCLVEEGELMFPRFGKFRLVRKPARQGRNPRTGETVMLEGRATVKFKASLTLQEAIKRR